MLHPQYVDPMYPQYPGGMYAQLPPGRVCGIQLQQTPPGPAEHRPFTSNDVDLKIRQQPKEALVTIDGKEKNRKPVDPPPIVQLNVRAMSDPHGHYMQSPYLIMICDLWDPTEEKPADDKALAGTICSSLHRLKDIDNKDGAFFVFGDISIKKTGEYRLRFSLFDILKCVMPAYGTPQYDQDGNIFDWSSPGAQYEYITSVISEKFRVVSQKEFRGLDESTYLSRAFSDQGVRLRLRKEPRHVMGSRKRSPPQQTFDQSNAYQTPSAPPSATAAHTPQQYSYQNTGARSPPQPTYDGTSSYPPPTPNASHHTSQYGGYTTPNPYDHADAPPAAKRSRYSGGSGSSNLAVQPPSQGMQWQGGADFNYGPYSTSTPGPSTNHHHMRSNVSSTSSAAGALAAVTMSSSGRLPVQGSMQGQSPEQAVSLPRTTDFHFGSAPMDQTHMLYFGQPDGSFGGGGGGAGGSTGSRRE